MWGEKREEMKEELQRNFDRKEYEKRILNSLKKAKNSTKNFKESRKVSKER